MPVSQQQKRRNGLTIWLCYCRNPRSGLLYPDFKQLKVGGCSHLPVSGWCVRKIRSVCRVWVWTRAGLWSPLSSLLPKFWNTTNFWEVDEEKISMLDKRTKTRKSFCGQWTGGICGSLLCGVWYLAVQLLMLLSLPQSRHLVPFLYPFTPFHEIHFNFFACDPLMHSSLCFWQICLELACSTQIFGGSDT